MFAESLISLVPQNSVSVLEHQSDATEAPVSCVDQPVFLIFWPILFGSVDVSEAFGCCTDSSESVVRYSNHHKRRLSNVPNPAGTTRPKLQPHSRVLVLRPLPLIQPSEQSQTIPTMPLEILAEEAHRTRGQSSERGTMSWRRVMSTASSASPSGWASDELFVLRDVRIPPGTPCFV